MIYFRIVFPSRPFCYSAVCTIASGFSPSAAGHLESGGQTPGPALHPPAP